MQPQSMPAVHQRQRATRKRPHERLEQVQPQLSRPEPRNLLAPLRAAAFDLDDDRGQLGERIAGRRINSGRRAMPSTIRPALSAPI